MEEISTIQILVVSVVCTGLFAVFVATVVAMFTSDIDTYQAGNK